MEQANKANLAQGDTDVALDHPNFSLKNVKEHISTHQNLFRNLAKYKQEHILDHVSDLNHNELEQFYNGLEDTDFALLSMLYNELILNSTQESGASEITPIKNKFRLKDLSSDEKDKLRQNGLDIIAKGKASILLLSGGQGTRLGFEHAKGMYNIGMPSGKTFFEYFANKIMRVSQLVQEKFGLDQRPLILWYIMTSEMNHQEIVGFLEEKNYFGLGSENVKFLSQPSLPALNLEGKIIAEDKNKLHMSPNGNGGLFSSLVKQGILKDMKARGIEYVHIFGVDNILAKPTDPFLLGFAEAHGFDATCKFIPKKSPQERVGVHVLNSGRPSVVEYSEISTEMANLRGEDGVLVYDASHILNAVYRVDFLEHIGTDGVKELDKKYHIAKKKVKYYDTSRNEVVTPADINAYKFELFIFDAFLLVEPEKFGLIEVKREEEFAPVKNAPGSADDSPDTARELMATLHQSWFEGQGVKFNGKASKEAQQLFEIDFSKVYDEKDPNLNTIAESYKGSEIKLPQFIK